MSKPHFDQVIKHDQSHPDIDIDETHSVESSTGETDSSIISEENDIDDIPDIDHQEFLHF